MSRSFGSVGPSTVLREFEGGSYDHPASREHFRTLRRDGKYYVERYRVGADGKPTDILDEPVDYVMGSGNDWISYFHRTRDNKLVEFPVSWYSENGGHWGMSPGYDRANHVGFSRQVFYRCMFCHNGYPDTPKGAGDYDDATVFPAKLPEGIGCERCHGEGKNHMAAARQGKPIELVRAAIVNPARLSPERQVEICMQCHLETTQTPLPGAIRRFDRGVFSYRPGEPLTDYMIYFDHAQGTGHDEKFELISAAYRLRKSACFAKGSGGMTCTGCHDPHRVLSREESQSRTDSVCMGCHEVIVTNLSKAGKHTSARNCGSCHMERRRPTTAIHIAVTDHLIARPGKTRMVEPIVEEHDGNTIPYTGEVTAYYPREEVDPLYYAVAQVKDLANVAAGIASLQKSFARSQIRTGDPYFELGEALFATGEPKKALSMYQTAIEREPDNWRYIYRSGQASLATGKVGDALHAFERAIALAPAETTLLYGLAQAYEAQGRIGDAVQTFREVSRRIPKTLRRSIISASISTGRGTAPKLRPFFERRSGYSRRKQSFT